MKTKKYNSIVSGAISLFIIVMFLNITSCNSSSGNSSSDGGDDSDDSVAIALSANFKNVDLTAGQQTEIKFTYTLPASTFPAPITSYKSFSVNLADTMQYVTLSSSPVVKKFNILDTFKMFAEITNAIAASTGQVSAFISFPGDPNVCSSSIRFGPYNITGSIESQPSSQTSSVSPTAASIDIINSGSFEMCIVIVPPIDAYLTVSNVSVDLIPCDQPPVDIVGTWTGTYQCTNFGIPDLQGPIELTITKNADGSYHYTTDDGGASYEGHLCGNVFKHNGGKTGEYTESGTLILNSDGSGSKTSTWNSIPPGTSGGNCTDTLQKM